MQELRLVAVSEDGSYLVLATAGRGTRFTLPVDDRLRAAVRGHFSRLGQFEIEVESPLRPKEIQARIRAGETAEEIAESAGIPVERVRWFEGPVLQEREYMAQQAQRVVARRPGETSPGPPLGEIIEDRLARRGVDLEEVEWDSWKCEDSTWRVRLSFFAEGRPGAAEWMFNPRRRHVSPLDEEAARLSSLELDSSVADTVTPLVPRRPAMKVVSDFQNAEPAPPRAQPPPPAPPHDEPALTAQDDLSVRPDDEPDLDDGGDLEDLLAATRNGIARTTGEPAEDAGETAPAAPRQPGPVEDEREAAPEPARKSRESRQATRTNAAAAEADASSGGAISRAQSARQPKKRPKQHLEQRLERPKQRPEQPRQPEPPAAAPDEQVAAAANGGTAAPAAKTPSGQPAQGRRKSSGRGKRASVPSWDEIMFGSRRPE